MTDLEIAKSNLAGHTICLCKGGNCLFSESRGISTMMSFIERGINLLGYSVADVVVGKAAALLFVKCGIVQVYAKTLSQRGKRVLEENGIPCECETLAERIINREGTDTCPMEKAVWETDDAEEGYTLLKKQLRLLKGVKEN